MEKKITAIVLFAILIFGCIQQESPVPPAAFGAVNGSSFEGKFAKEGSIIQADYTLMLENGSILDSSIGSVALDAKVWSPERTYAPMTFPIKKDNGYLEKFTYSFVGMYEGQKKRITLSPKEAYGLENESKIISNQRYFEGSRYEAVPLSVFTEKNIDVQVNSTVWPNRYWNAAVVEIRTGSAEVLLRHNMQEGLVVGWYSMPETVVEVTNETYRVRLDPIEGESYSVPNPENTQELVKIRALKVENETVYFDYNHPLAGKTIMFDIVLVKILQ
ncbi:hypothetical protein COV61_04485 [Candidatus Micrarchaeota archaeon CG11_big_fil_rev_8_21_14_0_20_47_5]|nr:MAG: hypothetical protein AUJ17_03760 [Candidatus Micrarchaeota archaeon CG1_02_47_40]PIN82971.1 MAG: hypothetical protein COV61_04485 [Candidatus Micrarchaeota archaeon CG11_big_fil_rev_8_21_14_0_20_47_5]